MMDPLSVTASAMGLILFVAEVGKLTRDVYAALKHKPHLLGRIAGELDALHAVLVSLQCHC